MIIRKATIKDAKEILKLYSQSKNLNGDDLYGYELKNIEDYIKQDSVFVAIYKNKIVGAMYLEIYSNYVYLHTIVVDKKYRKIGIGKQLLKFIEDLKKSNSTELVELMVEENNKGMQHLLEKLKYRKGKKFIYYAKELK